MLGWLDALITGSFSTTNNAANIAHQVAENEKDRKFNAEQAQLNRDFQSKEAELAYDRQVDFYNTTQSPQAMVSQYKEAGLNPALLAGGVNGSSTPQYAPSGSAASSKGAPIPQMTDVMKDVIDIQAIKASIEEARSRANLNNKEAEKVSKETSWIDTYNTTNIEAMKAGIDNVRSNIELNEQKVNESIQEVRESIKRMDKMDSEISVNGALVDLHGSQAVLNDSKAAVERLNAKSIDALLPYIQARQEAEIALTSAKTEESKASSAYSLAAAESAMYEANLKMLKVMVEQKLIDSSYYDSVIDQAHWDVKYKKREHKWQPVNDICHNVSMIAIGVGSVMNGSSSVKVAKNSVPRNYEEFIETDNYGNRTETLR